MNGGWIMMGTFLVTFDIDGVSQEEIRKDLLKVTITTKAGGIAKVTDVKIVSIIRGNDNR